MTNLTHHQNLLRENIGLDILGELVQLLTDLPQGFVSVLLLSEPVLKQFPFLFALLMTLLGLLVGLGCGSEELADQGGLGL